MSIKCRCLNKLRHCKTNLVVLVVIFAIVYVSLLILIYNAARNMPKKINKNGYELYLTVCEERIIPGLGNNGQPARLKDGYDIKKGKMAVERVGINTVLSDRIPLNRKLPDPRHPLCKKIIYKNTTVGASVIVIFYNEHLSIVLRTIWSVLLQTPGYLLREIVLVDDASTQPYLNTILQYYIDTRLNHINIKLVTLKSRQGLIKAKLEGARVATGDVLVFLDAHIEVTVGWLDPLLQRIEEDHTAVVVPIIDTIERDTFAYTSTAQYVDAIGGFTWDGYFVWSDIDGDKASIAPVNTPTMLGGLFAINRKFFWDIGAYDDQMEGWGGENLEISFRIWQCGGKLEMIPCSVVGHIFRPFHPYTLPNDTFAINTARLAEVWMDDYKRMFYMHRPDLKNNPVIGDLTKMKRLRETLNCKSFRWFLDNVFPQKFIPDEKVYAYGQARTTNMMCLDDLGKKEGPLGIYMCHSSMTTSQFFSLTLEGQLRREDECAEVIDKRKVYMKRCAAGKRRQLWKLYKNGTIYHPESNKCLTVYGIKEGEGVIIVKCSRGPSQTWRFTSVNMTALNRRRAIL